MDEIIHAYYENFLSVCGASWIYGRRAEEFHKPLPENQYFLTKCTECEKILKERGALDDKNVTDGKIVHIG